MRVRVFITRRFKLKMEYLRSRYRLIDADEAINYCNILVNYFPKQNEGF